ncbi:MAG: ABC transporter ATP-binding protein [Dorea sp.]|jgi:cobalt/nickel transport system ATP-binding protein|nr:ABC transporter ATP-binding protein [Dorea sp.]
MNQTKKTQEDPDILLKAENLRYTYEGEDSPALNGLSLTIKRGKKIACMGPNGSGKSTFFLCCNGIHRPESGTLYYNGRPIGYTKKELLSLRQKVGIVFQDPDRQLFSASIKQEISFGPLNLGCSEEVTRQKVSAVMKKLDITPYSHKPTHSLSGGQKKLVSIADILVMEPELIILDEPAAFLDPFYTETVHNIIRHITEQGITVMMATHDVNSAYLWADEVLMFHEGRLLKQGPPSKLFSDELLLKKTHLRPPMLLTIFRHLQSEGIISKEFSAPKNMEELKSYLSHQKNSGS